jgi:uncharacterized delta-60 repeat protein
MKIIRIVTVILLIFGVAIISYSSILKKKNVEIAESSSWAKTYGTELFEHSTSIEQTSDSGYIMAGFTATATPSPSDKKVLLDSFRVLKLKNNGKIEWQKTYIGAKDYGYVIHQTKDGGYIVTGQTDTYGSGGTDVWVIKLNKKGKIEWQKTYGGGSDDGVYSIQQTNDSGYMVAGFTNCFGAGGKDFWLIKLNNDGSIAWQKTYGGTSDEIANSIVQTTDGGYILTGWTTSFGAGKSDFWVLKLNSDGSITWQKTYGGAEGEWVRTIIETKDGCYLVSGLTMSFGAGNGDIWVIKLDGDGAVVWQKTYGSKGDEGANSMQMTDDGGCIVAGATTSFGAGSYDVWLLKLNSNGMIEWQKTYGGTHGDWGISVQQTKDNGYIITGETSSFGLGNSDMWVLKVKEGGTVNFNTASKAITTDTTITPFDTSATITNTTAQCSDTNITPKDTNVVPSDSNATITNQSEPINKAEDSE